MSLSNPIRRMRRAFLSSLPRNPCANVRQAVLVDPGRLACGIAIDNEQGFSVDLL